MYNFALASLFIFIVSFGANIAIHTYLLKAIQDGLFRSCSQMMKLIPVMPYLLKRSKNIYKSRDTLHEITPLG